MEMFAILQDPLMCCAPHRKKERKKWLGAAYRWKAGVREGKIRPKEMGCKRASAMRVKKSDDGGYWLQ